MRSLSTTATGFAISALVAVSAVGCADSRGSSGNQGGELTGVQPLSSGDPTFQAAGLAALTWEGYWYSRYNLGHLLMRSGNGETFTPDPSLVQAMVNMVSDDLSTAVPPLNSALIARIYDENSPVFVPDPSADPANPNDFRNFRWGPASPTTTTSLTAQGWAMLKEIEWAKQFHVDSHFGTVGADDIPGAQQRFAGLVLFAEALMQALTVEDDPSAFTSGDGGEFVMLMALSDLATVIAPEALPHSQTNRCRQVAAMMMALMKADEVAKMFLSQADAFFFSLPTPQTVRERGLAIQALTWYALASAENAPQARVLLAVIADQLMLDEPSNATELGYSIRALIDAYRISRKETYA